MSKANADERIDPFHGAVFDAGASSERFTIDAIRASSPRLPAPLKASPTAAIATLQSPRHWTTAIGLLGAVHGWRGLMPQQAARLLDEPDLASHRRPVFAAVISAGLIDVGVPRGTRMKPNPYSDATVWRAADASTFDNRLSPVLTDIERASVLGRQPWRESPSYDRHLVLSAELGIRAAEYLPWVGTVLGEQFSGLTTMGLHRPASLNVKQFDTKAADLTIVRSDGLRIAVELTATATGLQKKVDAWAAVLVANPLETSGLVVVFVDGARDGRNVRRELEKAIRRLWKDWPGALPHQLWDRLLVSSWRDWFPQALVASGGFSALVAGASTGPGLAPWKRVSLEDYPFDPVGDWKPAAVIDNAAILGQTPAWLRRAATPLDPACLLLRRAGLESTAWALQAREWARPERLRWPGLKTRSPVRTFTA